MQKQQHVPTVTAVPTVTDIPGAHCSKLAPARVLLLCLFYLVISQLKECNRKMAAV
jgi:hypothetical protein